MLSASKLKVSFDLAIVFDGIAERDKDVFDALPHQSDRMQVSRTRATARNGNVETFALGAHGFDAVFQESFSFLERLNDSAFGLLNQLAKRSAVFGRDPADQFLASREGALLARMPRPQFRQRTQFIFRCFQAEVRALGRINGKAGKALE